MMLPISLTQRFPLDPHFDPYGKRADGTHGAKSFRSLPFWGKNAHKALQIKGWEDFYHLVRMRSAVRIRPAAPRSPVFSRKQDFFFAYFSSMGEGMKRGGRISLPLRKIRLAYRTNNACYTVIIFSHSIYSSANSDSTREGLQIYPISICPRSVMGTLTKERRRSSCVR